jgi:transaldolase
MMAIQRFHELGQSLWLDHITRDLLNSGKLKGYIDRWSVTGLSSDLTHYARAIRCGTAYDAAIHKNTREEKLGEELFFELALEDLRHAADLFRPIYDQTDGVDGWVTLGVSPLSVHDADGILNAASNLCFRAQRPNIFITIPGTESGLRAVEEAIFIGVPVNVILLFCREHYLAAAEAFLRGIERRIAAGLKPNVASIASVGIGWWDEAVKDKACGQQQGRLGLAMANQIYRAYRDLLCLTRWQRAFNAGARPQRLLWVGTKPAAPDVPDMCTIKALAAPLTVNAMSAAALEAFAEHVDLVELMPADGGDCESVIDRIVQSGIDIADRAALLQKEGEQSLIESWIDLMTVLASRSAELATNNYVQSEKE